MTKKKDSRKEYRIDGLAGQFGDMSDLDNEPNINWLIKGWLAGNELSCLYGKGGTFKSYWAIGISLQLARMDIGTMYLAAEGSSGLRSRVDAWMAQRHQPGEIFPSWGYYNSAVPLDQPGSRKIWMSGLESYMKNDLDNLQLVVVDTLARNFSGEDTSSRDMGDFVEGCEIIRREYNTAVLIIHHTTNDGKRERGTETLRNAMFAMYKAQKPYYNETAGGSVEISCDRMKDAIMPAATRVKFDTVSLDTDEHGDVHRQSQAMQIFPPKKKAKKPDKVKDAA